MDIEQLFKNFIHTYITEESRIYIPSWIQGASQTSLVGVVENDKYGRYLSVYCSPTIVPAEQRSAVITLSFQRGFLKIDEDTRRRSNLMRPACTLMRTIDHFEIWEREQTEEKIKILEGLT